MANALTLENMSSEPLGLWKERSANPKDGSIHWHT